MTKFFLPKQPGSHYKLHHKKKKQPTNCNETIVNNIFNLLKKDQVKQTLKKIKKIKQSKDQQEKLKHLQGVNELKSITKPQLRQLACHITKEKLTVDEESIKSVVNKITNKSEITLSTELQKFYDKIKMNKDFHSEIQKAMNLRNDINDKKKAKKLKAKLRKKTKLELRKEKAIINDQNSEQQEEESVHGIIDDDFFENQQSKASSKVQPSIEKKKPINKPEPPVRKQRTQFKKTGRNKVLQEKRENKYKKVEPKSLHKQQQSTHTKPKGPISKFERLNAGQELHPSWQAKRHIKNEMFIQPFSGKKTLL